MNRQTAILISLAICAVAISFARADDGLNSLEDFSIIFERNIFDKSRRPPSQQFPPIPQPQPEPQPQPQRTERNYVLRGTVREGIDQYIAFVENTRNNSVMVVKAGDVLAEGRVTEIKLDSITYESDRGPANIEIGRNFEGAAVASSSPASQSGTRTAPSGASERELLEMLRRRREQEAGRGAPVQRTPAETEVPAGQRRPPEPSATEDSQLGERPDEDEIQPDNINSIENEHEEY